jgi:alpha-L-rhamnosidase
MGRSAHKVSIGGLLAAVLFLVPPAAAQATPGAHDLTANSAERPLGLDAPRLRLGWKLTGGVRQQSAYRIQVWTDPHRVVWDSGRVASDEQASVPYGGAKLRSATRYHWRVRVWDARGRPAGWSAPTWWETGLLADEDWAGAEWIGAPESREETTFEGTTWIWYPEGDPATSAPAGTRYLRRTFTLPDGKVVASARALFTADNQFEAHLNGQRIARSDGGVNAWQRAVAVDVSGALRTGPNVLAISAVNEAAGPAGLIGVVAIVFTDGSDLTIRTDEHWRAFDAAAPGWTELGFDDAHWPGARVLVPYGEGPWGRSVTVPPPPNPLLRTTFELRKPVRRARAYIVGLGYHDAHLNGIRVGDHVLDPAWTDYGARAFYSTHDVTEQLRRGGNSIAVALGSGWFGGLASWNAPGTAWDGRHRLKLLLDVEHPDGTSTNVVTRGDGSWRTLPGPTTTPVAPDITPDSERHDARVEPDGWTGAHFDDAHWEAAETIDSPPIALQAAPMEPIRVQRTLRAVELTEPKPGVFVYDFGTTFAGWARLRVRGSAGTEVRLKYGEWLNDDGTVQTAGVGERQQTDTYVLRGGGDSEAWEPRFTYKGLRYVQVTGYPGTPGPDDLIARRAHSDVAETGSFDSSNPLLDRIHELTASTELDNHQSVPTDGIAVEKLPWIDAGRMTDSTFTNFDMQRLYRKWLDDIRDSQDGAGQVANWAPSPTPEFKPPTPAWGGGYVYTAWNLYRYYGDTEVLSALYDSLARYVDYELNRLDPRGLSTEEWGDYLAPIASTAADRALIGTAWVKHSASVMARIARVLNRPDDVRRFEEAAARVAESFNAAYLDEARGYYHSGAGTYLQGNNVVALTFGIVPTQLERAIADRLARDVRERGYHLTTGSVATKWLLPVLTDHGHLDVAYRLAIQPTNSWAYWIANGATSLWENWTLNPRSRSHWHMGGIDDWFYQYLAGIKVIEPGYRHIQVKPYVPDGLDHARAEIQSVRGTVSSSWRRTARGLALTVRVPPGTSATVHVPSLGSAPAQAPRGARFLGDRDGFAVYDVGPGSWSFRG